MSTLILARHGRTTANDSGILAGRTDAVTLDATGVDQAAAVAARVTGLPLNTVITSPLRRCLDTVAPLLARCSVPVTTDDRLTECGYGDWSGQPLKTLAEIPLWSKVQNHPSAVVFPGADGEALAAMASRAVAAVREWDVRITTEYGADALWLACTHGDVIKAILADALGLHLDLFQRITVDPGSLSVIRYTSHRPMVLRINDTGGELSGVIPASGSLDSADGVIGGGAGAV